MVWLPLSLRLLYQLTLCICLDSARLSGSRCYRVLHLTFLAGLYVKCLLHTTCSTPAIQGMSFAELFWYMIVSVND